MASILPSPKLVGFFGRDADHGYQEWLSMLRYVTVDIKKVVPIDLRVSPDQVLPYQNDFEKFPYCRYLMKKTDLVKSMSGDSLGQAGFITARPELTMIWDVFQRRNNNACLTAILFKGVIYLFYEVNEKINHGRNVSPMVHKFYQSMLSVSPNGRPDTLEVVKEIENFYGMFEMKLKNNKVLYKSVIDGVLANSSDKKKPISNKENENTIIDDLKKREFVKLKLWSGQGNPISHPASQRAWLQGHFSKVSKIYFGCSKGDKKVSEIKEHTLEGFLALNKGLKEKYGAYFVFMDDLFSMIKKCFADEISKKHNKKNFDNLPIISLKFKSNNNRFELCNDLNHMKLPDWYVDGL